jgi:hypothetical protein
LLNAPAGTYLPLEQPDGAAADRWVSRASSSACLMDLHFQKTSHFRP